MISRFSGKERRRGAAHSHVIDLGITVMGYDGRRTALGSVMVHDAVPQDDNLHIVFVLFLVLVVRFVLFIFILLFFRLVGLRLRRRCLLHNLGLLLVLFPVADSLVGFPFLGYHTGAFLDLVPLILKFLHRLVVLLRQGQALFLHLHLRLSV